MTPSTSRASTWCRSTSVATSRSRPALPADRLRPEQISVGDPGVLWETEPVTTEGVVRVWHDDEGWGVLDSPSTPGGCWVGFGDVLVPGYRRLTAGQRVTFGFEAAQQDGYAYRATEAWPADSEPLRVEPETGPSDAYRSTLRITWHSEQRRDPP